MTALEQQVWAAAFAADITYQRELCRAGPPSGYVAAMAGDRAVKLLREAFAEDSADFLPLTEPST